MEAEKVRVSHKIDMLCLITIVQCAVMIVLLDDVLLGAFGL